IGRFLKQPTTDVLIFLERIHFPSLLLAKQCVLIPNQEWFPLRERYALKSMDAILCKTAHALSIFSRENASSYFIGFESRDRKKNELEQNYSAYLHVAGKSRQKGTETLLRVWQRHPEWPQLTVLYLRELPFQINSRNILLTLSLVPDDELVTLQNTHGVQLCLSEVEGFGHYIAEAMSCEALVITTDAPPMNELIQPGHGVLVPYSRTAKQHLGHTFFVDESLLELELERIIASDDLSKRQLGRVSRQRFLTFRKSIRAAVTSILSDMLSPARPQYVCSAL